MVLTLRLYFSLLLDFDAVAVTLPRSERVRRLSPDHSRLCQAKEVRLKAKDFFRGRFSDIAIITPPTFRSVHCVNNTTGSHSSHGQRCLGVMNCKETRITKNFVVYDLSKAQKPGCLHGAIATIHNVPVECSCQWPLYLGKEPSKFFQRQHSP